MKLSWTKKYYRNYLEEIIQANEYLSQEVMADPPEEELENIIFRFEKVQELQNAINNYIAGNVTKESFLSIKISFGLRYCSTSSFTYEQLSEWKERELIEQILELQNTINNYIDYED